MQTTPFPEAASPELEQYALYSRLEIGALLQQLGDGATPVTAYFGAGTDFAVTIVLQVDVKRGLVVLDNVADPSAQERLLAASDITFVAFLANIKLQFSAERAEACAHQDKPAFRIALPEQLLRLQRRDSFRVRTPISKPATVLVPCAPGSNQYESLRVLDLSVGGLSIVPPQRFELEVGALIENCFLELPGVGSAAATLRVLHFRPLPNDQSRRCGCRFVELGASARLMVQRYVNKIDAEQRRILGSA